MFLLLVVSLVNSASSDACEEMATGTTPSAADEELHCNFQGVIITPLVGLI